MNEQSDNKSKSIKATVLIALIQLLAALPLGLSKLLLRPFAWLQWLFSSSAYKVSQINLAYCFSDKPVKEVKAISRSVVKHNMNLIAETSHIWLHGYATNKKMLKSLHGMVELKQAVESDRGTLIYSPHIGNWELTYGYLSNEFKTAAIYRPPNIPELESIMQKGRDGGGSLFRTQARDIRNMLKELKQGGSLFLLPDQQPPKGSGVFAPFFGKPAYTMTLVHGLLNRTGSDFWLCYTVREDDGYALYAKLVTIDASLEAEEFATELNLSMEEPIMQTPEQYQWAYKRFKMTPDGSPSIYNRKD